MLCVIKYFAKSLKIIQCHRILTPSSSSYWRSISEVKRDIGRKSPFFIAMLCICGIKYGRCCHAVSVRSSVCVSARSCILSKWIKYLQFFSLPGSHTILVFFHKKRYGNIPTGTPEEGVECRWGRQKSRFSTRLHRVLSTVGRSGGIHYTLNCAGPYVALQIGDIRRW